MVVVATCQQHMSLGAVALNQPQLNSVSPHTII